MEKLVERTNVFYLLCLIEGEYCALKRAAWETFFCVMEAPAFFRIFLLFIGQVFCSFSFVQTYFYVFLEKKNSVKEYNCSKERHVLPLLVSNSTDNTRKWEIQVESLFA